MSATGDPGEYGEVISGFGISSQLAGKNLTIRPVKRYQGDTNELTNDSFTELERDPPFPLLFLFRG